MGVFDNLTQSGETINGVYSTFVTITGASSTLNFRNSSSGSDPITQAVTAVNVEVLASDATRNGASFSNDGDQIVYILLANTPATVGKYTVQLPASSGNEFLYETPYGYTGPVNVIFAGAGAGNLIITEFTV